jgi:hypothetical protein
MQTKLLLTVSVLFLAGCQTTPPAGQPLPDLAPLRGKAENYADRSSQASPPTAHETPSALPEEKPAPPAQIIEALIAQNDALTARLHAVEHPPTPTPAPSSPPSPAAPIVVPLLAQSTAPSSSALSPPPSTEVPLLTPNAQGTIDATALTSTATGGLPNPFAVRAAATEPAHDITFDVQGIVTGAQPCALVNGHVVEAGDTVESLRLAHLSAGSLILKGDGFALNLPFGATKVRLPL